MIKNLKAEALEYHEKPKPGKIAIQVTKPTKTQYDLSLAYTPGVAEPVRKIAANPDSAYKYTAKGNLVAVITDGSAVLGLGNVGALAGKPVMEGKAVLFKAFADIDVFDIEVDADEPKDFIDTVKRIASGFGGINLEDITAPKCFEIEHALTEALDIPVFHDDQHGTAVIISAGLLNALEIQEKTLENARITIIGAGAAGIASAELLCDLGADADKITMVDRSGVIHTERTNLNKYKRAFARETNKRTLEDAMECADIVIGVSGPDILTTKMIDSMADHPIVFALSNPDPEIHPELAFKTRTDLIMATGRSDFPNQVNNVLGFPYIFRGALDARATTVNKEMLVAAVHALRDLTREPVPESVLAAYELEELSFGKDYIIPKPFDPRLMETVPQAVMQAAIDTGVIRKN